MARFFFDLDGVLADFDAGCVAALGMGPTDYIQAHGEPVFWKRLSETPRFYADLAWCPGARSMFTSALTIIKAHSDVAMVLTGLPLGDWAAPDKRAWCARELPGIPVLCCLSRDKPTYCASGDVLLDDRESVRVGWERSGGTFLLHTSPAASLAAIEAHYG